MAAGDQEPKTKYTVISPLFITCYHNLNVIADPADPREISNQNGENYTHKDLHSVIISNKREVGSSERYD